MLILQAKGAYLQVIIKLGREWILHADDLHRVEDAILHRLVDIRLAAGVDLDELLIAAFQKFFHQQN